MKRLLIGSILATIVFTAMPKAEASHYSHDYDDRWHSSHDSRTIYVIENRRPVRRVVYIDDRGRYYRHVGGRRVYVTQRYFTSYPSRYYYADGRPRIGVSINF
jgi:hypothetical protein